MSGQSADAGASQVTVGEVEIYATLKSVFGFDSFRPLQEEIVNASLAGGDVFALLPTGGGKSLCYQLPALLRPGLTVVVSPLIALMKDQVDALAALGVPAAALNSALDPDELQRRQAAILRGELKLVYVAPERLMLPGFQRLLERVPLAGFAIDEAHCISEWGHDFRPEYRALSQLRERFPGVPLAAFTATATERVEADILGQLGLAGAARFRGSFNRSNLYYEVRPKRDAYRQLIAYLRGRRGRSGIIYCHSRNGTDELADKLRADGFRALAYHAGLESEERRERQEAFTRDEVEIMVATVAFGMGIDKPDVRFVIHYNLPKNLESYYQESGRAGRDGDPSDCILFFSRGEVNRWRRFVDEKPTREERQAALEQLDRVTEWASSRVCRRSTLLAYFGEEYQPDNDLNQRCCDVCRDAAGADGQGGEVDWTVPAQMFLSCVKRTDERFGASHVIDVLRGGQSQKILQFGHDRLSTYGVGRDHSKDEWRYLADALLDRGYLRQNAERFNALEVTPEGWQVLRGEPVLLPPAPVLQRGSRRRAAASDVGAEDELFEELRQWRLETARRKGVPPYVIFHDATLRALAEQRPDGEAELRQVAGVGERKAQDFGAEVLEIIAAHLANELPGEGSLSTTVRASLSLFRSGADLQEIVEQRGLAPSTVAGHLAEAIQAGVLGMDAVDRLIGPGRREAIEAAVQELGTTKLTSLREHLGEDFDYAEIRFAVAAMGRA